MMGSGLCNVYCCTGRESAEEENAVREKKIVSKEEGEKVFKNYIGVVEQGGDQGWG